MARLIAIPFILLVPFLLCAQKEIEAIYDPGNNTIRLIPDSRTLQSGNTYRLIYRNVNPVYIQDKTRIRSFRYISSTPEILESILPGIPGSNVFQHFDVNPSGQREFFLKALRFFNELEILRSESDDLYLKTRLAPDPVLATRKMDRLDSLFNTAGVQEMVSQTIYYLDYILAAESVYKTNIKKITLKTPDADIVLQEYARLTRIADKIRQINYIRFLDYIVQSTETTDPVRSEVFKIDNDITNIHMILYDQYINDTLYTGKLTFHTEKNWYLDFTTGFFFTNLYDKDYFLEEIGDTNNRIREEKKLKGDVSIGALAHYTYKVKPDLRIGPALGASISPFDGGLRYLAGLGIFTGKEKILGLSAGITFGQTEVLSGGVTKDAQGPFLPEGKTRIPTYEKVKTGFFVGLTYNLTRNKAIK